MLEYLTFSPKLYYPTNNCGSSIICFEAVLLLAPSFREAHDTRPRVSKEHSEYRTDLTELNYSANRNVLRAKLIIHDKQQSLARSSSIYFQWKLAHEPRSKTEKKRDEFELFLRQTMSIEARVLPVHSGHQTDLQVSSLHSFTSSGFFMILVFPDCFHCLW